MNRKKFISAAIPATALLSSFTGIDKLTQRQALKKIPPYLVPGDTIGITCPAGFIYTEDAEPAITKLSEWGFKVKIGNTIGKKYLTMGGTDEERCSDFQQMLNDSSVKAILCARGGYGFARIIDDIDFTPLKSIPKWVIGFSDITVLHCHIQKNIGIASIHSKMCNSFPRDWNMADEIQKASIDSIYDCLTGKKISYTAAFNPNNRLGTCTGELVGGNLKTILSLIGTSSEPEINNKILFVEDTGEYLYSIDRMFLQLKRSGKLKQLRGLIIGGFKLKKDDEGEEFGKTIEEIVAGYVKGSSYPVCFDFPVGHQKNNFALKCGIEYQLSVTDTGTTLKESA